MTVIKSPYVVVNSEQEELRFLSMKENEQSYTTKLHEARTFTFRSNAEALARGKDIVMLVYDLMEKPDDHKPEN